MNLKNYKPIESGYDNIANSNYHLYSIPYNEIKIIVRSWYNDVDLTAFDSISEHSNVNEVIVNKVSGIISNLFFAYHENGRYYLLDGFKRLLTEKGNLDLTENVYIKVYTDMLNEHELNKLLYLFNQWKLNTTSSYYGGLIGNMFDRGIKLFYKVKFNIDIYDWKHNNSAYDNRMRNINDMDILKYYFMYDSDIWQDIYTNDNLSILMKNERIISDIRNIININNYLIQPFGNYDMFIEGYCKFLSYQRIKNNISDLPFDFYVDELKKDNKFYKKLIGMSGNESTRKNIYNFFKKYETK